jgi:prepilin-type N-terminal cleavage/methylation domain-containing protein
MQTFRVSISPRTEQGGFTLLELLIVVLLVSIFISFASVNWNAASKTGREALLEDFSVAVSLLREEAVSNFEERVIQFDITNDKVFIGAVDQETGFIQRGEIHLTGGYNLTDVVINGESFSTGKCYMTFHSSGMVDRTVIHLEGEKQYYSLLINPLTAKITGENGYTEETTLKERNNPS